MPLTVTRKQLKVIFLLSFSAFVYWLITYSITQALIGTGILFLLLLALSDIRNR